MNILVFGASGGTGRELVKQGLDQGHRVTAYVRDPSKIEGWISRPDVADFMLKQLADETYLHRTPGVSY